MLWCETWRCREILTCFRTYRHRSVCSSAWCENTVVLTPRQTNLVTNVKQARRLQQLLLAIHFSTSLTRLVERLLLSAVGHSSCESVRPADSRQPGGRRPGEGPGPPFHRHTSTRLPARPHPYLHFPSYLLLYISLTLCLLLISGLLSLLPPSSAYFLSYIHLSFFPSQVCSFRLPIPAVALVKQSCCYCSCRREDWWWTRELLESAPLCCAALLCSPHS